MKNLFEQVYISRKEISPHESGSTQALEAHLALARWIDEKSIFLKLLFFETLNTLH